MFNQQEYDKWLSYQEVKRQIAKRKQAEAQERSKKEMLKALEGEDISHIDINSEEGNIILIFLVNELLHWYDWYRNFQA